MAYVYTAHTGYVSILLLVVNSDWFGVHTLTLAACSSAFLYETGRK